MIYTNLSFPRKFDDNGAIQRIVIHHAAGTSTVEAIHQYHISKGWNGIAYHYFVDKDGAIYTGRPENAMGAGCTGYNYGSIHICFNGNYNKEQLTKEALKSGLRLLVDLMKKYPSAVVVGHKDVNNTECPGNNFPLLTFKRAYDGKHYFESMMIYLQYLDVDEYARFACLRGIESGIFKDGDNDGLVDFPKAFISRQDVAVLLDRLGAFDK